MALVALVVVLAACGNPADGIADQSTGTSGTVIQDLTTSTRPGVTSTTLGSVPERTGRRTTAPDFTLELGDGGTYTLSVGEKPVYLVFWAEW